MVEQFLAAESISAKASLVRDSARVAPLMADWYRRHPRQLNAATAQVDTSGTGFYPNDREHTVTSVRVAFPAAEDQVFLVEHSPAGDRIEWESSVGYNASPDQLAASGQDGHSKTVRAMGCLDDYFNFSYSDRSTHLCVRLHDPASRELLGYGYIPLDSAHAESIAAYLSGGSQEELRPLMVEVRPRDDTGKTHQMEIVRMIETGWRSDQLAATSPEPPRIDLSQFNQRPQ